MSQDKDRIHPEEEFNGEPAASGTVGDGAAEAPAGASDADDAEAPAAPARSGKYDRLTQEEGGVRKLTGMYKNWFLDYASYVILERAVPHVEEGIDVFHLEDVGFVMGEIVVLFDTAGDLGAQYGKRYEFIIYANKGRAPFNPDVPRYDDVWAFPRVTGNEQIHQNQKPTDLLSRIIRQHTRERELILDPFMGSFATAVAAYKLQRDFIGFEIDKDEYDAGVKRLNAERAQVSIFDIFNF